ncbi:MAG: sigma-70 family RNA polymerase sigma factor [bacterium]|nr:sigma-70 family RNA polymerase sigma factor [bacterium]
MSEKSAKRVKRDTYTLVYNEYYPLVFNTVYSRIGNREDASDICQEIFLIFFEKFEGIDNYRKWLFGTMRNIVLRFYERKSSPEVDVDKMFDDMSMAYVNGFRDARIIITDIIENIDISENERALFDYIALNNYSYNNTGKILGLSKKQVILRYGKIAKMILLALKEKGIHDIGDLL